MPKQVQKPPIKKLYTGLIDKGLYTKSFKDFQNQFSNIESRTKLYNNLSQKKLYTKDIDSFNNQFFSSVKKKDGGTESLNEDVSQELASRIQSEFSGTPSQSKEQQKQSNQEALNIFTQRRLNPKKAKFDRDQKLLEGEKILFNDADNADLEVISEKYGVKPTYDFTSQPQWQADITGTEQPPISRNPNKELEAKLAQVNEALQKSSQSAVHVSGGTGGAGVSFTETPDIRRLTDIKKKLAATKAEHDLSEVQAVIRRNESGSKLNKFMNRALLLGGNPGAAAMIKAETLDYVDSLDPSFIVGLNYYKDVDPVMGERVTDLILNQKPLSESQKAMITNKGLEIQQALQNRELRTGIITPEQYQVKTEENYDNRVKNLTENPETLRAVLSNGIAEYADEINRTREQAISDVGVSAMNLTFGHRWNYTDEEIKRWGEKYAKDLGLNPDDANVQSAIEYLQNNEGIMIWQNSIAKNGLIRELGKGLENPVRAVASTVEDITKDTEEVYAESQSQGNVNVAEQRLKVEDKGWRGVVNDVVKGTGEFVTQAALAYAGGQALGAIGRPLAGTYATTAGQVVENAGLKSFIGNRLINNKNFLSTLISSYAQSYDSNLKNALNYTSDDSKARGAAIINSTIEGLAENILSPVEIAQGIKKVFTKKGTTEGLLKILSDKNLMSNPDKLKSFLTNTLKGGLQTAKVAGAEILEEWVTQAADYATEAYLNPQSLNFQNRDLMEELGHTAYETGVSMAIPSLLNGVAAYNANNFSKGSLLISAQNRQSIIDNLKQKLVHEEVTQDEFNRLSTVINTAFDANNTLPTKANGQKLNSDDKANYVYSRVSEAAMKRRIEATEDEAEKKILEGKIKEQQKFREGILEGKLPENEVQVPIYRIDGRDVSRDEFLNTARGEDSGNYTFEVQNDKEAQGFLRSIGGIDEAIEYPQSKISEQDISDRPIQAEINKEEREKLEAQQDKNIIPTFEKIKSVIPQQNLEITENTIKKVNNAEQINVNELESASDVLYQAWDNAPEARHLIEPLIQKLQDYEFATTTETGTVAEKVPTGRTAKTKIEIKPALEQSAGTNATITLPNGDKRTGTINIKGGQYVLDIPQGEQVVVGEKAITDRDLRLPTPEKLENPIVLDENGNVQSVTFETSDGNLITINDAEKALDLGIQLQMQELGEIPDGAFQEVYEEVEKQVQVEVPKQQVSQTIKSKQNEQQQDNTASTETGISDTYTSSRQSEGINTQGEQQETQLKEQPISSQKKQSDEKDDSKKGESVETKGQKTDGGNQESNRKEKGVLTDEGGVVVPAPPSIPTNEKTDSNDDEINNLLTNWQLTFKDEDIVQDVADTNKDILKDDIDKDKYIRSKIALLESQKSMQQIVNRAKQLYGGDYIKRLMDLADANKEMSFVARQNLAVRLKEEAAKINKLAFDKVAEWDRLNATNASAALNIRKPIESVMNNEDAVAAQATEIYNTVGKEMFDTETTVKEAQLSKTDDTLLENSQTVAELQKEIDSLKKELDDLKSKKSNNKSALTKSEYTAKATAASSKISNEKKSIIEKIKDVIKSC